jgi:hypothetical protein
MTENNDKKELDELKGHIARLREEIAALSIGVKKFAEIKPGDSHADGEREERKQEDPPNEGNGHDAYTDFQHMIDEVRIHGEKVITELAGEIKRHPLVGSIAAFSLGFIIARLWYKEGKQ